MAKDWQRKLDRELQKEALKEFEGWTHSELVTHIREQREEIEELKAQQSAGDVTTPENAQNEPLKESRYDQTWSFATKITFLITLHNRPLTSEDLHGYILKLDSHYKDLKDARNFLSVTLQRTAKSGRIKKIKLPGIRSLYFALPEWGNDIINPSKLREQDFL
ncbi:MAG: hypothetical protein K0S33_3723 [Bacteroidetes bacterium]|jgi:ribosomal protein L29|nr:hypothetical protein [Bacteroidota bacterium]